MKQNSFIIAGVIAIVILSSSMFVVNMTQSAIVLELSKPKETIVEPGLYFKIPFLIILYILVFEESSQYGISSIVSIFQKIISAL